MNSKSFMAASRVGRVTNAKPNVLP
jgi:hypothetical protein